MKKVFIALIFLVLGIISSFLLYHLSLKISPYWRDSAGYIEAARSIKAGKGVVISQPGVWPIEEKLSPLNLWPPGYPFLIYLTSLTGIDENLSAILVPAVSFIFLPLIFFLVFKQIMRDESALLTGIVCAFIWSNIIMGLMALSDLPFLLLALMSLASIFYAIKRENQWFALLAGILSGGAQLVRHVGYALIFSILVGLSAAVVAKTLVKKKLLFLYIAGVAVVYLPLIIWNYSVFHSIQPYSMLPSEASFWANVLQMFAALNISLLGDNPGIIYSIAFLSLLLVALVYFIKKYGAGEIFGANNRRRSICLLIIGFYALSGTLFVIVSRTKYQWGEKISFRHLIQYNWVLAAYLASFAEISYKRFSIFGKRSFIIAVSSVLLVFLALQGANIHRYLKREFEERRFYDSALSTIIYKKLISPGSFVVSNKGYILRILWKRNVRQLEEPMSPADLAEDVTDTRDLWVILFKNDITNYPEWSPLFSGGTLSHGYKTVLKEKEIIVLFNHRI